MQTLPSRKEVCLCDETSMPGIQSYETAKPLSKYFAHLAEN